MGWGRQDRNKFLFRTLFLTHVGLSSHMQTWTFQKVFSLIPQSPFSAVPGGHRESLSPLRKMSLREKKGLPPISGFDLFLWRWQEWVLEWEALCLPRDRGPAGVEGRPDFSILVGLHHCPGKSGETCQLWSFQSSGFSASVKALIILISSQLITINLISSQLITIN